VLAIQNEREWERFCAVALRDPAIAVDPRFDSAPQRFAHREELEDVITQKLSDLTGESCQTLLLEAQVAHARQRDMTEVAQHPQLLARDRWQPVDTPAGSIDMLLPPVTHSDVDYRMDPIPAVGEHTEALLTELGRTPEQIARLRADGQV
jgi:crotonobetainyl-CoA:carnitine CoA-transferase CaiB-like acyl-CoA transferase